MSEADSLPGAWTRFIRGILPENPVFRQLLGMCPTLAVTNTLGGAITMGGATTFVLVASNLVVSALRHKLQPHLRILVYTLTIATFVTAVDRMLAAFLPEMSLRLGPYVPLIIVNCLIISRAEVCASKQGLWVSFWDGIGQGLGFSLGLAILGVCRELLGSGSLLGWRVLPASFPDWVLFILPPGAFFTLGALIALSTWWNQQTGKAGGAE